MSAPVPWESVPGHSEALAEKVASLELERSLTCAVLTGWERSDVAAGKLPEVARYYYDEISRRERALRAENAALLEALKSLVAATPAELVLKKTWESVHAAIAKAEGKP